MHRDDLGGADRSTFRRKGVRRHRQPQRLVTSTEPLKEMTLAQDIESAVAQALSKWEVLPSSYWKVAMDP